MTGGSLVGGVQRLAGAAAALALAVLATASPAGAHAQLIKADPARDAVLAAAPESASLTFSEDLSDIGGTLISVVAPDGTEVNSGPVRVEGPVASVPLLPLTVAGAYTVTFRVVSSDAHIVNDSYQFQYQPPVAASPSAAADTSSPGPVTTAEATGSKGGLRLSVGKIATIAVFAAVYFFVARWLKAYRRRSLGR